MRRKIYDFKFIVSCPIAGAVQFCQYSGGYVGDRSGLFFLFFVVSSEFETLLWLCHHSDVFGNDGKQINTVISSCSVCRLIFSVAELRRSYIMAAARCVSSNSIYELFHIYLDWKP